jgi:hypothetical protein
MAQGMHEQETKDEPQADSQPNTRQFSRRAAAAWSS